MVYSLDRNPTFEEKNYLKGIGRNKVGKGNGFFYYYLKNNNPVTKDDLSRIIKLKIPPAWEKVWVSGDSKSPIQAIGYDQKKRKQYRYHESHIQNAEKEKFLRMYNFIKSIPKLDKIMKYHKNKHPYNKDRVITSMLFVVKKIHMRVGKECYAKINKSYGVSSLKKTHVKIQGGRVTFRFKGKSNKRLSYTIVNKTLAHHINLLKKLSGDKIFQYISEDDKIYRVTDKDLNEYIQLYMGKQFTCKDFRTYAANYYFVKSLLSETRDSVPNSAKKISQNSKE